MGTSQTLTDRDEVSELVDKVHRQDCKVLLGCLPDESVNLIVSSPPYNLGKEYESKVALEHYIEEQTEVLRECARVLTPSGSIFWQVGAFADRGMLVPLDIRFFPILESFDLIPRNRIIWARQHGLHATKKFSCRHESLLWFTKSNNYIFNLDSIRVPQKYQNKKHYRGEKHGQLSCHPGGKNPGDIWLFRNVKHNHEEQTIHPCQFPEDMIARIVRATTNAGDIVLDPYMGVGTVAVVARDHGRHFIGTELDEDYHRVALQRIAGEPNEEGVFPNLKTLRDYCERTGEAVENYRFAVQVGKKPSDRAKAKIFSEHHHLAEMEERIAFEESAFAADLRGEDRPQDRKLNGKLRESPLFTNQ